MINVSVTPMMLATLCGGHFTLEACGAICDYIEECSADEVFDIGDIVISFSEIPIEWINEYNEDQVIAVLNNGNAVVAE